MVDQISAKTTSAQQISAQQTSVELASLGETADKSKDWQLVLVTYNTDHYSEQRIDQLASLQEAVANARNHGFNIWLDVLGQPDQTVVAKIQELFQIRHLDPLELIRVHHRSKFASAEGQCIMVIWSVDTESGFHPHQTVLLLDQTGLLTFQGDGHDALSQVREKLSKGVNKSRREKLDYLASLVVSDLVDRYYPCLERYGERLEGVQDQIVDNPTRRAIYQIHSVKRDLLNVRKHIWSLREATNATIRDDEDHFQETTKHHLRDSYEHVVQLIDLVEVYRELCADLMDVYLSSISNRMNEVMKVLTIITTTFVPPALIAGIYGMNFHRDRSPLNMPELDWYYGYPFAIGLMFVTAITTLLFFWIKGWLGDGPRVIRMVRHKLHHKGKL